MKIETNDFFQVCNGAILAAFILSCFFAGDAARNALGTCLFFGVFSWGLWAFGKSARG